MRLETQTPSREFEDCWRPRKETQALEFQAQKAVDLGELNQQVVTKLEPTLPAGRLSWVIRTEEGGRKKPESAT